MSKAEFGKNVISDAMDIFYIVKCNIRVGEINCSGLCFSYFHLFVHLTLWPKKTQGRKYSHPTDYSAAGFFFFNVFFLLEDSQIFSESNQDSFYRYMEYIFLSNLINVLV